MDNHQPSARAIKAARHLKQVVEANHSTLTITAGDQSVTIGGPTMGEDNEVMYVCQVCGSAHYTEGTCCGEKVTDLRIAVGQQVEMFAETGRDKAGNVLKGLKLAYEALADKRNRAVEKLDALEDAVEDAGKRLADFYKLSLGEGAER
jgi:hypothetical protein